MYTIYTTYIYRTYINWYRHPHDVYKKRLFVVFNYNHSVTRLVNKPDNHVSVCLMPVLHGIAFESYFMCLESVHNYG